MTDTRLTAPALALAIFVLSIGLMPEVSASEPNMPPAARLQTVSAAAGGARLETQDAVLSAALVRVLTARTSENLAAVADRYYQLGIRDTALDYYLEGIRRNRGCVRSLDGAARIWRDWGEMGKALGSAYRASYFAPESAEAWNTFGTILQALGQNAAAADAYRRAISVDGAAVYARSNLCYLAFIEGDAERALAECSAAVRVDGHFAPALNNLALVYAAAGDRQRAADSFRAAGGEAVGHYNTGIVLLAGREYAAAVLAFEAAYRVEPTFDAAHARARHARRLAGRVMGTADGDR